MHVAGDKVEFSFVGDVSTIIPNEVKKYTTLYGNINDPELMHRIYLESDVLILTSAYEGLPIAIMEMMARGRVILSTAVDGIPDYITHLHNGLLIQSTNEEEIVNEGINHLRAMSRNRQLLQQIGRNSYDYAKKHFSGESFCHEYRELLTN